MTIEMTVDKKKLRDIATNQVNADSWFPDFEYPSPREVLALLDEIDRLHAGLIPASEMPDHIIHLAIAIGERDEAREQLTAMTATRDELASIADRLNGDMGDDEAVAEDAVRIAELRAIGGEE